MEKDELNNKIAQGYIHIRTIIEIVGKPEEYVEDALKNHLEKIEKDDSFIIIKKDIEPPVAQENFFSTFAELEMLMEDFNVLTVVPSWSNYMATYHFPFVELWTYSTFDLICSP